MKSCSLCGKEKESACDLGEASVWMKVSSTVVQDSFNMATYTMKNGAIDLGKCSLHVCRNCAEAVRRGKGLWGLLFGRAKEENRSDTEVFANLAADPDWQFTLYREYCTRDETFKKQIKTIHQELVKLVAEQFNGWAATELFVRLPNNGQEKCVAKCDWETVFLNA